METFDIFISVGAAANEEQESFIHSIEDRLRSEDLVPHTIGRNSFSCDAPLKTSRGIARQVRWYGCHCS
jgi:hypothetical protein